MTFALLDIFAGSEGGEKALSIPLMVSSLNDTWRNDERKRW
jgi:hypothetical protein